MVRNIAFSGKMCSGKTTLADYLVAEHGYTKVSFADGVYKVAREIFGMEAKDRQLLQRIGVGMRDIDREVWVNLLRRRVDGLAMFRGCFACDSFVCDDVRFLNEVEALQSWGWLVVRLECLEDIRLARVANIYPDMPEAALGHVSETELDGYRGFDFWLDTSRPSRDTSWDLAAFFERIR